MIKNKNGSNDNTANNSGLRLKKCRVFREMTQEDLAKSAYCTKQFISALENGRRPLTIEMAYKFSEILGVEMDYLLCRSDFMTTAEKEAHHIKMIFDLTDLSKALELLGYRYYFYGEDYVLGSNYEKLPDFNRPAPLKMYSITGTDMRSFLDHLYGLISFEVNYLIEQKGKLLSPDERSKITLDAWAAEDALELLSKETEKQKE